MNHDVSNSFSNLQIPQRHLHLAPFPPPSTLENHLVCEHHVCSLEFLALKKPRTLHSVKKVKYSSPIFWTLKRPHLGSAGSSTSFSTQRNRAHRRAGPCWAAFCSQLLCSTASLCPAELVDFLWISSAPNLVPTMDSCSSSVRLQMWAPVTLA